MPPVTAAVGEIWEVVLSSRLEQQQHLNVLHFTIASPVDDIQLRLLKAIVDCFLLNMMPGLTNQFTCIGAVGKRISPTLGNAVEYFHTNTSVANTGLASGDGLPSYCSAVVSIHTARGGRSGRGRMFIGGVPESATINSMLTDTGVFWVALLAFISCVVSAFIVGDPIPSANAIQMGVLSKKEAGTTLPIPSTAFSAMTNLVPHQLLATTRSRKVGRGS